METTGIPDGPKQAPFGWSRAARAGLGFRRAGEDDLPFLSRVYDSTRTDELAQLPWSDAQKRAFLDMQARAQHLDYGRNYPDADRLVIAHEGRPVGRLYLDRRAATHRIVDVALLPEARGRGFGTALIGDLIDEAAAAGKSLSIHVEHLNPAQRLYRRLGFVMVEDHGLYRLMVAAGPGQAKSA